MCVQDKMETIDFGCQVRCLNRQRLIPGSTHPQLNQCASKFLAKVKKEVASTTPSDASKAADVGWMKLKLSERGLRILPTSQSCSSSSSSSSAGGVYRKSDEGFESDSEHSDHLSTIAQPLLHHSGGSNSSGVNSSSSDIEETEMNSSVRNKKKVVQQQQHYERMLPVRCRLPDILSCQHPPALGRHVVLLTLRSADDSALDILALECSAEEPARILTLLCQKISSSSSSSTNPPKASPPPPAAAPKKATVSIQSWSEREKMLDALVDSTKPPGAASIIRQLERQHSEWNLIQRRTDDGVTHLQVLSNHVGGGGIRATTSGMKKGMPCGGSVGQLARLETALAITNSHPGRLANSTSSSSSGSSGVGSSKSGGLLKRSDTMHQKLKPQKSSSANSSSSSCILSLQTPELPMSITGLTTPAVANASTSTADAPQSKSRWSFGAPFRQQTPQRPLSPESSSRRNNSNKQRGRSSDRKSTKQVPHQPDLDGLFVKSSGSISTTTTASHSGVNKSKMIGKQQPEATAAPTKIKRDPSKTRSFLMKLTTRKSPTPPVATSSPPASTISSTEQSDPSTRQQRGRSLVRLRSSTRLQSPPPPLPAAAASSSQQTFLIPTKSGAELTRNIYPKEGCRFGGNSNGGPPTAQPVFHLLTNAPGGGGGLVRPPHHRYNGPVTAGPAPNGWAGYCWSNDALRHPLTFSPSDANNNQQQQQQQQQQWILFHPHPIAAPPAPPAALLKANELKRIQRSRSQSPGRRNSQRFFFLFFFLLLNYD